MRPLYGTICKSILVVIGVCILWQVQTAKCQSTTASDNKTKHTLYELYDRVGNNESEFLVQTTATTNSPIYETTTIENELPTLENTNDTGSSIPTTSTPDAEPPIERNTAFDDLDNESSHLYSRLINILNETKKLTQELKKVNELKKAVLIIGKSGSGKTTVAQIVAGNISRLEAKELTEDSGDYYIDDGHRINNGIESDPSALAEFIKDNETAVVLVDNPGFHDAAGAAKDLEIAFNMKTVAESFKYVRIALVCPHSSLKKGSYRSEFTSFLERVIDFLKNSDHFLSGISLIATKVKNSYTVKNKKMELVPESAELQAIANFMGEVKLAYNTQQSSDSNSFGSSDHNRSRLIVKMIQNLLTKRNRNFRKIKILRSPEESGPLINQSLIMEERESIRQMLLDEDGFDRVVTDSFGVAISATTRDSVDSLFRGLDSYIVRCTEEFGTFLKNEFLEKIKNDNSNYDISIESLIAKRKNDLDFIQSLRKQIGKCYSPEDFVGVVSATIESKNLTYHTTKLANIQARYEILKNIKYLSTKNYLASENWQNALKNVEKFIENEYLYQSMLQETFLKLREYKIEKRKSPDLGLPVSSSSHNSIASNAEFKLNPEDVIIDLNLARYACLEYNREKKKEFNQIVVKVFASDQEKVRCEDKMLIIIDKFVFVSEIQKQLSNCYYVDSIVIIAADTVVIDSDLSVELLEGRNLMMFSPQWVVQGKRSLVVSGKPHEEKQEKASPGEVGLDGKDGNPSGSFMGIGLHFKGIEGLTVQANGGNGQHGQDGGDGKDGTDGRDHAFVAVGQETEFQISKVYNLQKSVVRKEGQMGSAGQDSGAGGQGGKGGAKGSITIIDLAHYGNPFQNLGYSSHQSEGQLGLTGADGKPGNSGSNGCSSVDITKTHQLFGQEISLLSNTETLRLPCKKETAKGEVLRQRRLNLYVPRKREGDLSGLVCEMFVKLRLFIAERSYRSKLTLGSIDKFQKIVIDKLCP
ncbi:hypothetical protein LSTR_LSTR000891 [Laodelphax striatellus]|uniref:Guanylate kinase-like domain-containing protein n=1 Tax=Laodelphax striatellus TaxID=195883 RepID=A0A482X1W9_LAOST|nr:hypothetical protein LSTR_LSTR000891 [Laodelphax striatellus]